MRRLLEQIGEFWAALNQRGRVTLFVVAALVMSLIGAFVWRSNVHDYRSLYSGLTSQEAGLIVARLETMEVPYRLEANGTTILVPRIELDRARLQLATEGLPESGRLGFELFDQANFGATEFAERINFQRALEGELERTISSLAEVSQARAHITLPERSVFLERDEPAKASIVVRLHGGHALSREQTRAISYLVASAVEGLSPAGVVVMDQTGRLFTGRFGGSEDVSGRQLEFQRSVERDAASRILATLEPRLGPGGVRANVAVEVDWNSGERTEELVDPNTVIVNRQVTQESALDGPPAGAPGTASNLPRTPAVPEQQRFGTDRSSETTNFQSSRTVTRRTLERGEIQRMSIAVLVDHQVYLDEALGQLARRPRDAAELETVRSLVIAASGARLDRGDTVTVESLPFSMLESGPMAPAPAADPADELFSSEWFRKNRTPIILGALGVGLLVGVVMFFKSRRAATQVRVARQLALETERERKQIEEAATEESERRRLDEDRMLKGLKVSAEQTGKTVVLRRHLEEVATESPERFASLVRTWMREDD
ncbi:MAG: flagellar basal-body MS-ring/collar protein FliF [Acidobacteria bacterium]|nr:flagellar basal-body MS-ring/collar protein FliF [Acidobacteriota bacterium]